MGPTEGTFTTQTNRQQKQVLLWCLRLEQHIVLGSFSDISHMTEMACLKIQQVDKQCINKFGTKNHAKNLASKANHLSQYSFAPVQNVRICKLPMSDNSHRVNKLHCNNTSQNSPFWFRSTKTTFCRNVLMSSGSLFVETWSRMSFDKLPMPSSVDSCTFHLPTW